MYKHEQKICAVCGQTFECKVGDIVNCDCYNIQLTEEAQRYIANNYNDCICITCLTKIKDTITNDN
jgi:hypothetical protein